MKQQPIAFCCFFLVPLLCCNSKTEQKSSIVALGMDYILTVERGAFHYDKFVVTNHNSIYAPGLSSKHIQTKYDRKSKTTLDGLMVYRFVKEIEEKGFRELKRSYKTASFCTSELKLTFKADGKSKTMICDYFDPNCPDLIKYIDEKVVELEGNDLKTDIPSRINI